MTRGWMYGKMDIIICWLFCATLDHLELILVSTETNNHVSTPGNKWYTVVLPLTAYKKRLIYIVRHSRALLAFCPASSFLHQAVI
jgi:hypothetical protein